MYFISASCQGNIWNFHLVFISCTKMSETEIKMYKQKKNQMTKTQQKD